LVENRRFEPTLPLIGAPLDVTDLESRRDFWAWTIVRRCLRDPRFSRLSRTPTCDGQTDRRTDTRHDGKYRAII